MAQITIEVVETQQRLGDVVEHELKTYADMVTRVRPPGAHQVTKRTIEKGESPIVMTITICVEPNEGLHPHEWANSVMTIVATLLSEHNSFSLPRHTLGTIKIQVPQIRFEFIL